MNKPQRHIIDTSHPSLPGHFPGHPVVPGVVIVDRVFTQIEKNNPQWSITGIKKIKYRHPLHPGQHFTIDCTDIKNSSLRFKCQLINAATILVEGHLKLELSPASQVKT